MNVGGDLTILKSYGEWKSTTEAEGYIGESIVHDIEISNRKRQAVNTSFPL